MNAIIRYTFPLFCCIMLLGCVSGKQPSLDDMRESRRLVNQGTLFLRQGLLDQARASFSMARELDGSAAAIDGLGCVAMLEQRFEIAQRYFIRAYELDNNYADALGNLALLYELYGYLNEAETLYRRALAIDPKNFRTRNNYAAFLHDHRGGKDIRVEDEFNKAFSLTPHPLIKANLEIIDRRKYGSD